MKSVWSGLCVAFSLYSAIPVPQVPWEKTTMRWALSFLPLVGVLVGALELAWFWFCRAYDAEILFYAVIAALLPIILTGGIHLDGFADTCDALCSFGEQEKRLAILKDPHIGAFGVIWLTAFLMAEAACFAQIYRKPVFLPLAATGFVFSRAVGGRKIVTLRCARDSGLAYLFSESSDKSAVAKTLAIEWILCAALVLFHAHGSLPKTCGILACLLALLLWDILHKRLCLRDFGGITGDLAGFFISVSELLALAAAAFGGLVL